MTGDASTFQRNLFRDKPAGPFGRFLFLRQGFLFFWFQGVPFFPALARIPTKSFYSPLPEVLFMDFYGPRFFFSLQLLAKTTLGRLQGFFVLAGLRPGGVEVPRARKAQTAIEYLLLVALGVAIVVVGIAVAGQLKGFSDTIMTRVSIERNSTMAMLVR